MPFVPARFTPPDVPPEELIHVPQPDYDDVPVNELVNMMRDAHAAVRGPAEMIANARLVVPLTHMCEESEDQVRYTVTRHLPWDMETLVERLSFHYDGLVFKAPIAKLVMAPVFPLYGTAQLNTTLFAQMMWEACYPNGTTEPDEDAIRDLVEPLDEFVCALPFLYGHSPTGADEKLMVSCIDTVRNTTVFSDAALYGYEDTAADAIRKLARPKGPRNRKVPGLVRNQGIFRSGFTSLGRNAEEFLGDAVHDWGALIGKSGSLGLSLAEKNSRKRSIPPKGISSSDGTEYTDEEREHERFVPDTLYHDGIQSLVPYTFSYRRRFGFLSDIRERGLSFLVAPRSAGHHNPEQMLWMNGTEFREFVRDNKCAVGVCESIDSWQDCHYLVHTAAAFGYLDDDMEHLAMVTINGSPASYAAMRELAGYVRDETPSEVVVAQSAVETDGCISEDFGARCPVSDVRYHPLYDDSGMRAYWQWTGDMPDFATDTYDGLAALHLYRMLSSFARTLFDYRKKVTGELADRYVPRTVIRPIDGTNDGKGNKRSGRSSRRRRDVETMEHIRETLDRFLMAPGRATSVYEDFDRALDETTQVYADLHASDPVFQAKIESRQAAFIGGVEVLMKNLIDPMQDAVFELRRNQRSANSPQSYDEYVAELEREEKNCTPITEAELEDMLYDFFVENGLDIMIDALYDGVPLEDLIS